MKFQKKLERETALSELSVGDTFRHLDDDVDEVYMLTGLDEGWCLTMKTGGKPNQYHPTKDDKLIVHLPTGLLEVRSSSLSVVKLYVEAQARTWTPEDAPKAQAKAKRNPQDDYEEGEDDI